MRVCITFFRYMKLLSAVFFLFQVVYILEHLVYRLLAHYKCYQVINFCYKDMYHSLIVEKSVVLGKIVSIVVFFSVWQFKLLSIFWCESDKFETTTCWVENEDYNVHTGSKSKHIMHTVKKNIAYWWNQKNEFLFSSLFFSRVHLRPIN